MKIDNETLSVLKNFAKINPSIVVPEGNVLKTISTGKTIMAKATVTTSFEQRFAIYNLDRFLATLSMFAEPELTFEKTFVTIAQGGIKTRYAYADESTITKAPEKTLVLPSVDASFKLTPSALKEVEKALGVLGLPEIVVAGDGTNVTIQAADTKNSGADNFSVTIGDTDKVFKAIFKSENIRIIPGEYDVQICSKGISHWECGNVEYFIAVEATSTFGG